MNDRDDTRRYGSCIGWVLILTVAAILGWLLWGLTT